MIGVEGQNRTVLRDGSVQVVPSLEQDSQTVARGRILRLQTNRGSVGVDGGIAVALGFECKGKMLVGVGTLGQQTSRFFELGDGVVERSRSQQGKTETVVRLPVIRLQAERRTTGVGGAVHVALCAERSSEIQRVCGGALSLGNQTQRRPVGGDG